MVPTIFVIRMKSDKSANEISQQAHFFKKFRHPIVCNSKVSLWTLVLIVGSESVLRSVIGGWARVSGVTVRSIGLLLLVVNWHQVLQVHGVLCFPVVLDAKGGQSEEDGGEEGHAHSHPTDDVGPVVAVLVVPLEHVWPAGDVQLRV